ncbi:MAG: ABC transporter permease [Desulfamplus sp.]|nr:ABC transporter permease [Desulfamplus sp.]
MKLNKEKTAGSTKKIRLWMKMALREIIRNPGFALFFIVNLSVGLAGFIALHSFNHSIDNHLKQNLNEILGADIAVQASRPFSEEDIQVMDRVLGDGVMESRQVTFFSMLSGEENSRLVRVVAVDNSFPLYGNFVFENRANLEHPGPLNPAVKHPGPGSHPDQSVQSGQADHPDQSVQSGQTDHPDQSVQSGQRDHPGLWLTREASLALGVDTGEIVRMGNLDFKVAGVLISYPDSSITAFEFAPRIYMGISHLENTGLTGFGSRIRYAIFYKLPGKIDAKQKAQELTRHIQNIFDGTPPITVQSSEDANRNLDRFFGYFTGYMGLVAIVAIFLAGIGTAYLFRGYINAHLRETAILMTLGARRSETCLLLIFQLMLMGLAATILSVLLSFLILPLFPGLLGGIIPENFETAAAPSGIILAAFLGIPGSVIFCLPVFAGIYTLKPVVLLRGIDETGGVALGNPGTKESKNSIIKKEFIISALSGVPALLTFWILAVWQSGSMEQGTIFFAVFFAVMVIMAIIGFSMIALVEKFCATPRVMIKIALRNLHRHKVSSMACFVTIAMGAFLMNLIPQIKNGIQEEIARPEGLKIPGFFLIDIQPEQLSPLGEFLHDNGLALTNASPMVRGRITSVNGEAFNDKGTFRRREFNFSCRESLDISETIIKGKALNPEPWDFESDLPMEISLEEGFAERLHLNIGDSMTFDIQGIPMEGRVVNLRKVRWNSFQPNFFILFQKGVLDDAPRTYLASIPQMPQKERMELQNDLVRNFPNISVLDVNRTVNQMLGITDRLTFAINFMAWLAVGAGLVVLFSIVRHETRKRSWEINLLKVLGAGFSHVRLIVLVEFGFLGFSAAIFAVLLSLAASYGISWLFFEGLWSFGWGYALLSIAAITGISILTALAAAGRVIRQKPVSLLNSI